MIYKSAFERLKGVNLQRCKSILYVILGAYMTG